MSPINTNSSGASSPAQSSPTTATDDDPPPPASSNAASASPSKANASDGKTASSGGAEQSVKPVDVGSLFEKATQKVSPTYPAIAKTQRITGVVKVYLLIDETGAVASIERTSGPAMLQQAAMDAARRWKFRPTMVDGQAVRVVGFINFNFTL